jgi:hypothetical protein
MVPGGISSHPDMSVGAGDIHKSKMSNSFKNCQNSYGIFTSGNFFLEHPPLTLLGSAGLPIRPSRNVARALISLSCKINK